ILPDLPDSPKAMEDIHLKLDGGADNDVVFAFGGEMVTTIGGTGRDWIYNTSNGGVIWGDGRDPVSGGTVADISANADNIWYSPNTVMKDAQHVDVLKYYGLTLTGGNAEGGITGLLAFGGMAGITGMANFYTSRDENGSYDPKRSVYFDHLFPWM